MAWIDDGAVVVGSSVCTFESAAVFVFFCDGVQNADGLRLLLRDVFV